MAMAERWRVLGEIQTELREAKEKVRSALEKAEPILAPAMKGYIRATLYRLHFAEGVIAQVRTAPPLKRVT